MVYLNTTGDAITHEIFNEKPNFDSLTEFLKPKALDEKVERA